MLGLGLNITKDFYSLNDIPILYWTLDFSKQINSGYYSTYFY